MYLVPFCRLFQSTLSVRRATDLRVRDWRALGISIHALRKESDLTFDHYYPVTIPISIHALRKESDAGKVEIADLVTDFNPRSP